MTKKGMINITGAAEGRVAPIIADIICEEKGQSLIVVSTINRARRLATDLSFFSERDIYVLPQEEETIIQYEAKSNDELLERMKVLRAVSSGRECVVIAPVTGAIKKLPPREIFAENTIEIGLGSEVDTEQIKEKLTAMGYERASVIENRGEFSIRGGIIDIFTPDSDDPYRVELFDTEVDSIRTFDIDTQRSIDPLDSITVYQCSQLVRDAQVFEYAEKRIKTAYDRRIKALEKKEGNSERVYNLRQRKEQLLEYTDSMMNLQYLEKFISYFYDETVYIWDYMTEPQIFIDDPARILETLDVYEKERADDIDAILEAGRGIGDDFRSMSGQQDYFRLYQQDGYIFTPFVSTIRNAPPLSKLINVECRQTPAFNGRMDVLKGELDSYVRRGYHVTIVCSSDERMRNMEDFLEREELAGKVTVKRGTLTAGMEFSDRKVCYIWEGDIFGGSRKSRKRKKRSSGAAIKNFADVQAGDYVVHESHGIGKFIGIEQLVVQGVKKDYLKVKYAGEDSLYIPVDQLGRLQKYVGGDVVTPKLNRRSGNEWKQTKARARKAVDDMAQELIRVSAARMKEKGHAFSPDTVWQKEFEDSFPYTETDDQLRCVEEIKADMEKESPMDRLLCGDVGFGKTEVAARALFKCVADGKQAAVLVPTTLLANQHYYTLKDRFEEFPFKVEMLSRFRNAAQQKHIAEELKKGRIDLVIGTHRLLSEDMEFKDLGLLVIDEEQRFGVKHKEKLKQLKTNVDVLTLSATPIPRTLHMSLSGVKDMSIIEEPPEDRYPVQTYVMEQDDFVIRDAIEKELARGGQVYVLYNRVESIERVASDIEALVPEASVIVGHGKMRESKLENVIMDFAEGEYNVLVATTIIESGTDIPNVNTMIVLDADRFGLAQLHQLRGRVGRSGRMAYAYLMYRKDKTLSEVAEKRLRAIKEFTEFGSGFKIAMKDLELRGAGNLLGTEQSGHMMNVGYELYCKMLEEAVEAARGRDVIPPAEETAFSLSIPALIPEWYIENEVLRLQMYKKIAMIENDDDEGEIVDELLDRFGDIPKDTMNLIKISKIRAMAGQLGVSEILQQGYKIIFKLWENVKLTAGVMSGLMDIYGGKMAINGGKEPFIRLTVNREDPLKAIESFLRVAVSGKKDS
ncbi:MAG: transcription-repair coupling factor [Anaerovoracaceae bacterium]|nr:transcription-repair coupling factor [Anaerovoracaceae bacterium]